MRWLQKYLRRDFIPAWALTALGGLLSAWNAISHLSTLDFFFTHLGQAIAFLSNPLFTPVMSLAGIVWLAILGRKSSKPAKTDDAPLPPIGASIFDDEIAFIRSLPLLRHDDDRYFELTYMPGERGRILLTHHGHFFVKNISGHPYPCTIGIAVDEWHWPKETSQILEVKYKRRGVVHAISDDELTYNRKHSDHHVSFEQQLSPLLDPDEEVEVWTKSSEIRKLQDRETYVIGNATQRLTVRATAPAGIKFYPAPGHRQPLIELGPNHWQLDALLLPNSHFALGWVPSDELLSLPQRAKELEERLRAGEKMYDGFDDDTEKKLRWADALIEREREEPDRYIWPDCQLRGWSRLKEDEPNATLVIKLTYKGSLRLVVHPPAGKLSWDGLPFAREPDCNIKTPEGKEGPAEFDIALTQYMDKPRADTLKQVLDQRVSESSLTRRSGNWDWERPSISFGTDQLTIPIRLEAPDGEAIYDGPLRLGRTITVVVS